MRFILFCSKYHSHGFQSVLNSIPITIMSEPFARHKSAFSNCIVGNYLILWSLCFIFKDKMN